MSNIVEIANTKVVFILPASNCPFRDETPELRTENVTMCYLVRVIDEYRAILDWRLAGRV